MRFRVIGGCRVDVQCAVMVVLPSCLVPQCSGVIRDILIKQCHYMSCVFHDSYVVVLIYLRRYVSPSFMH